MRRRWLYSYHFVLAAFGVLAVACVLAAALLDPDGTVAYLGLLNLGTGSVTLVLTVVLVERVLEHRRAREREQHWREVREHSVASLWVSMGHVAGLAYAAFLRRPEREAPEHLRLIDRVIAGCERPTAGTGAAIEELARLLRAGTDAMPPGRGLIRRARWWVHRASRHLDHVREAIIPRLLQATTDHELNRLLMRLDQTGYALQGRLVLAGLGIRKAERMTGTREAVAALLAEYAGIARHLEAKYLPEGVLSEDERSVPGTPEPVTNNGRPVKP
jgi:hypothetical protein